MTLRNGKFYNSDGQVVPLEFGNKQQIEILAAIERMRSEGEEPNVHFNEGTGWIYDFYIQCCACHSFVRFPYKEDMEGLKKSCKCGLKYIMHEDNESSLTVKVI